MRIRGCAWLVVGLGLLSVGCVVDPGNAGETLDSSGGGGGGSSVGSVSSDDGATSVGSVGSGTGSETGATGTLGDGDTEGTTGGSATNGGMSTGGTGLFTDATVCDPIGDERECDAIEGDAFVCAWLDAVPVVIDDDAGTCTVDGDPLGWCVALPLFMDGCGPSNYTCNDDSVEEGGAFRTPQSPEEPWVALTEFYGSCSPGPFWTMCNSDDAGTACECQCGD